MNRVALALLISAAVMPATAANRIEDMANGVDKPPAPSQPAVVAPVAVAKEPDGFVVGIYGRGADNLTAEIVDQQKLVIAKAGTDLPSGWRVVVVEPNSVLVEKAVKKGKKTSTVSKRLWMPSSDALGAGGLDFSMARSGGPLPMPGPAPMPLPR